MNLPLVSVGVPVYNGAAHLAQTLDSLLAQRHARFEIIISDDCSTDGSYELCRRYADRSPAIRLYRAPVNIGATRNHNKLFGLARGEYFFWSTQSDLWHPGFIGRCLAMLERYPESAMCHAGTQMIDGDGGPLGHSDDRLETLDLPRIERVQRVIYHMESGSVFHGLYRSAALARTALLRPCFGHDLLLLAELSLHGAITRIDERLFFRRVDPDETQPQIQQRWCSMIGLKGFARNVPYLTLCNGFVDMVDEAPLAPAEQEQLLAVVVEGVSQRFGSQLAAELAVARTYGEQLPPAAMWDGFNFDRYLRVATLFALGRGSCGPLADQRQRNLRLLGNNAARIGLDLLIGQGMYRIGFRLHRIWNWLRAASGRFPTAR